MLDRQRVEQRILSLHTILSQLSRMQIEELDLSHCKLKDKGAHAVGEFLSRHQNLKILHLTNNNIGPIGVAGIVHGLLKASSTALKHLDFRLNPLQTEGANHICARKFNIL